VSTGIGFEPSNFRSQFDFYTKCITALGHSMISFFPHSAIFSWCQLGLDLNPQTSDHALIFLPNVLPLLAIQLFPFFLIPLFSLGVNRDWI
jgi:hypothetical protein